MQEVLQALNRLVSDGVIGTMRSARCVVNGPLETDMRDDSEKTAFNERAKASMREFLQAKSWVEKVQSIKRMNVASRLAKEAMRRAITTEEAKAKADSLRE